MKRITCLWSGPQIVGGGVTVLHFDDVTTGIPAAVVNAFAQVVDYLPTGVSITIPDNGEFIEETTGTLTGVWTEAGTGGVQVAGSGSPAAAAGVGACINWLTGGIENGHRVRGRTFLVPLRSSVYDVDGTLTGAAVNDLEDFGDVLLAAGVGVWHRPGTVLAGGSFWPATSFRLRDKVAVLTSRRD